MQSIQITYYFNLFLPLSVPVSDLFFVSVELYARDEMQVTPL